MKRDKDAALTTMNYTYVRARTDATTGYYSCIPQDGLNFDTAIQRLEETPMDEFLHLYLLDTLSSQSLEHLRYLAESCYDTATDRFMRPVVAALLTEAALFFVGEMSVSEAATLVGFPCDAPRRLALYSPTVHLRAACLPDHAAAVAWNALFRKNICEHHNLPAPEDVHLPDFFSTQSLDAARTTIKRQAAGLAHFHKVMADHIDPDVPRPTAQETFLRALDALMEHGFLDGPEMRHEASLSPIALLRDWRVDVLVENRRLHYTLRGKATAYGRGLSLAAARASYAMEIVERASAYVSVGRGDTAAQAGEILDRKHPLPLRRARRSELLAAGLAAFDPNCLPLEVPYADEVVHWLSASDASGDAILVPAQAVFLFCNLDEPSFFLSGGSSGLASGNSKDEAVVSALTEVVERDAEATTPFSRTQCFTLASRDKRIQSLLDGYANCGIQIQFQDLTTEVGIPAYKCFVLGHNGSIARATAANLSGAKAALAALTETPWPYSTAQNKPPQPSAKGLTGLPVRMLEDLPDYSLPSASANRLMLEGVLKAQGRTPIYVDVTRRDLDIPVVRAIVPGLALTADFDRFSRPDARLFVRYANLFR